MEEQYQKFKRENTKTSKTVSTDGKLTVPWTSKTARKPGQRKSKTAKNNNNQMQIKVTTLNSLSRKLFA